jgi:hypothetical protein
MSGRRFSHSGKRPCWKKSNFERQSANSFISQVSASLSCKLKLRCLTLLRVVSALQLLDGLPPFSLANDFFKSPTFSGPFHKQGTSGRLLLRGTSILRSMKPFDLCGGGAVGNNQPSISVLARRGALMLPFIGPEMFEWLLRWGAHPEDLSTGENTIPELNQDSSNEKTTDQQQPRQKGNGKPLKWKEY